MRETPFSDRAAFWLGVAAVLAAIGIVPVTIAIGNRRAGADLWSDGTFVIGVLVEAIAVGALWWAITLHVAHGHATTHGAAPPGAPLGPIPPAASPPDEPPAPAIPQSPQPGPAGSSVLPRSTSERTYVDLDADYLRGFFKELSGIQAAKLVEPYLNSWTRVSGTVDSLGNFTNLAQMTLEEKPGLYLYFDDPKWIAPLSRLRLHADKVTIDGRIDSIRAAWVDLRDCELVDSA